MRWDKFPGEARCWRSLGGIDNVEKQRIPAHSFAAPGLRLQQLKRLRWFNLWGKAKSGLLTPPGMPGSFEGDEDQFFADETDERGTTMLARGHRDHITPNACRWRQALSYDGGRCRTRTG